jgi:hypothetical protein
MSTFRSSSNTSADATKEANVLVAVPEQKNGYQWTALSVTTVGALLGAIQGSALLI